jgi:hypothetical protein
MILNTKCLEPGSCVCPLSGADPLHGPVAVEPAARCTSLAAEGADRRRATGDSARLKRSPFGSASECGASASPRGDRTALRPRSGLTRCIPMMSSRFGAQKDTKTQRYTEHAPRMAHMTMVAGRPCRPSPGRSAPDQPALDQPALDQPGRRLTGSWTPGLYSPPSRRRPNPGAGRSVSTSRRNLYISAGRPPVRWSHSPVGSTRLADPTSRRKFCLWST